MDEVRRLAPDHPDVAELISVMARRFPHWRSGWTLPAATDVFVTVYRAGRPAAGAALAMWGPDLAEATRFCAHAPDRADQPSGLLLIALEQAARDRGAQRLRLDESSFLMFAGPLDGYVAGPAYDGDADVSTWVERRLPAG
jgi:hypothetical protein